MQTNTMKKTGGHILRGIFLCSVIAACQPIPLPDNAAFNLGGGFMGEIDDKKINIFDANLKFLSDNFEISEVIENGFIDMVEQNFIILIPDGWGKIRHYSLYRALWAPANSKGGAAEIFNVKWPVSLSSSDMLVAQNSLGTGYAAALTVSEWDDDYCILFDILGRDESVSIDGWLCSYPPMSDSAKESFLSKSLEFISGIRYQ